ncbi:hypothetical protein [Nocardia cerradoensis]|uniref:Uncharacterized protein n=1 Tax=Nocardia cerradoensis TaxID=85688 RepID=A0A231GTS1_9NOCA|nr:hypothetical protein [Nocardia cerradoensis]NKY43603.1 hypothetical protein [Nocardia cerradoensis]OXR40027.1 hypothetical protein B7C42_07911 [Nocardia cerradoensis]
MSALAAHTTDEPADGRLDPTTVTEPGPEHRAPVRKSPLPVTGAYPPLFAVLGAHGGAGTSTLARWWAHAADTGLAWPASPVTTQRVVVAARECLPGLVAAANRLREWHAGLTPSGVTVVGLVLIPPRPGRVPLAVRSYRSTVAALVEGAVWPIRWHDDLLTHELDDLATYTPGDPPPARRAHLSGAVPVDVYHAGTAITARIAATRPIHPDPTPRRSS